LALRLTPHHWQDGTGGGKNSVDMGGELAADLLVGRCFERIEQAIASVTITSIRPNAPAWP